MAPPFGVWLMDHHHHHHHHQRHHRRHHHHHGHPPPPPHHHHQIHQPENKENMYKYAEILSIMMSFSIMLNNIRRTSILKNTRYYAIILLR